MNRRGFFGAIASAIGVGVTAARVGDGEPYRYYRVRVRHVPLIVPRLVIHEDYDWGTKPSVETHWDVESVVVDVQ